MVEQAHASTLDRFVAKQPAPNPDHGFRNSTPLYFTLRAACTARTAVAQNRIHARISGTQMARPSRSVTFTGSAAVYS